MAKVAKLRIRKEWLWRIWEGIVRYANGNDDQSNQASIRRLRDFRILVIECMNWIGGTDDDIEECLDIKDGATLTDLEVKHRPDIERVLAWIAAPNRHRALGVKAVDFLSRHGTGIRMHISAYRSGDTDEPLLLVENDGVVPSVGPRLVKATFPNRNNVLQLGVFRIMKFDLVEDEPAEGRDY